MKMKPQYRKSGYSNQTAEQYVNLQAPIYLLSDELESQQKFEDGKMYAIIGANGSGKSLILKALYFKSVTIAKRTKLKNYKRFVGALLNS